MAQGARGPVVGSEHATRPTLARGALQLRTVHSAIKAGRTLSKEFRGEVHGPRDHSPLRTSSSAAMAPNNSVM